MRFLDQNYANTKLLKMYKRKQFLDRRATVTTMNTPLCSAGHVLVH